MARSVERERAASRSARRSASCTSAEAWHCRPGWARMGSPTDAVVPVHRRPSRRGRREGGHRDGADREHTHQRDEAPARPSLFTPAFITVALAELAYFTADGMLLPALPRYVEGPLGRGNIAVGLVIGAFSISAFFLRPWAGGLADRRGRRLLMMVGASVFALSVVGYLFATSVEALFALRLLTGAGEAFFFVAALAANVDLAPEERRGEAFSFASLALYLGPRCRAVHQRGTDRPRRLRRGLVRRDRAGGGRGGARDAAAVDDAGARRARRAAPADPPGRAPAGARARSDDLGHGRGS